MEALNAKRLRNKRMNALKAAYRWQKRLIAGHHYRWCREAREVPSATWDPTGPERHYPPQYPPPVLTNKELEKRRLTLLWGLKWWPRPPVGKP